MNHQNPVARIGFHLINTTWIGVGACISSRITTVIQVAKTIKYTITDIMSHSQFHSIDLFILRHAWLNLWDKRMLLAESTRLLSLVSSSFISKERKKRLFSFTVLIVRRVKRGRTFFSDKNQKQTIQLQSIFFYFYKNINRMLSNISSNPFTNLIKEIENIV